MVRLAWLGYLTLVAAIVITSISGSAAPAPAQQAYIKASNTRSNHTFGMSAAVSGETMVIGAPQESSSASGVNGQQNDDSAPGSGAAYVFLRSGTNWSQQAYLKPESSPSWKRFGSSVAVSADTVVVGAPHESSNPGIQSGAVYVFRRHGTNWSQQACLRPLNPETNNWFGWSVALSGDILIIGAPYESTSEDVVNRGAAYIYARRGTNWHREAHLSASELTSGDHFGYSVSISHETAVIGAPHYSTELIHVNETGCNLIAPIGAAYVFGRSGTNWSQRVLLKESVPKGSDRFGISVAISGDIMAIAGGVEYTYSGGCSNSAVSVVHVFRRSGTDWLPQAHLRPSTADWSYSYGWAVAVSGEMIVVGGPHPGAQYSEAAFVFVPRESNWIQQTYIRPSNTNPGDYFGWSVAASGDTVAIGAPLESSAANGVNGNQTNNSAPASGAAYVFTGLGVGPRLALAPNRSGGYLIRCSGAPGVSYQLRRALTANGPWIILDAATIPTSGILDFVDATPLNGQGFYRVIKP